MYPSNTTTEFFIYIYLQVPICKRPSSGRHYSIFQTKARDTMQSYWNCEIQYVLQYFLQGKIV